MSASLLLKIPCILATALAVDIAHSPPSVAPKETQQPKTTFSIKFLIFIVEYALPFVKILQWLFAIIEVAVVAICKSGSGPAGTNVQAVCKRLDFTPVAIVGLIMMIGGSLLRVQCFRIMGKYFTMNFAVFDDHKLATTGPYSIIRHPSYFGAMVLYIGLVLWHAFPGSFLMESGIFNTVLGRTVAAVLSLQLVTTIVALFLRSKDEDAAMHRVFGDTWEEWEKRVPYAIIPYVF
ncbi:hypothetical protein C0993_012002 [Termitomyces sp. T159_Od127]|nr:hypothetical protein C0993_012002 [Termitomyces sp. T159_Od127]